MVVWRKVPIKEVYEGLYDGPHATPKPSEVGPIFLGIKNVGETGQLDLSDIRHISEAEYPRWTKRVEPRRGDIVFSYEATLNRYAMIPKGFRGCLGRRMALIRTDESKVCGRFLYFYFFGPEWRDVITRNILTGSTVDRIPIAKFPDFPVNIPPLPTQKKIAAVLSSYDDLIDNNERRIKILEEMAQNLYREWFVKFRFPNHKKVKMVDSPLGKIPEEWEVKRMEEVSNITIGKTPPRKQPEWFSSSVDDVKWVSISDMNSGVYINNTKERVTQSAADKFNMVRVPDNTVLMSFKLTVGRLAITIGEMTTNEAIAHFVISDGNAITPEYVYLYLNVFKYATLGNTSSIGTAINSKIVKQMPILTPDEKTLANFSLAVVPMFNEIKSLLLRNQNLRQTRDLLLPKLISGEVDVSELDIEVTEAVA